MKHLQEKIEKDSSKNTLYMELLKRTLEKTSYEDAIFILCEFLKTKIPFGTLTCFSVDRKTMLLTSFIDYTPTENRPGYLFQLKKMFPKNRLEEFYGKSFDDFFLSKNIQNDPDMLEVLKDYPYNCKANITFCLYITKNRDFYILVSLYSEEEAVFTQEHVQLLKELLPLTKDIIIPLYLNSPESHLFINASGPLPTTFDELLRACPAMKKIVKKIETVAKYDTSVLIGGATGSGKEIIASSIHALSNRFQNNFVRVNCSAIAENLLESEFFGHEKGAFTGAIQMRKGYFEQADKGTIYLDEIGDLSLHAQTRLLRVLENREIQRIGSERLIKLDFRIIAATHRNLEELVKQKLFREDLYYRLNTFPIEAPALTQRKEDIPILIEYFYKLYCAKFQLTSQPVITSSTLHHLLTYSWPGNVRQLKHSIERALIESIEDNKKELNFDFLPKEKNIHMKGMKYFSIEELEEILRKTDGKIQGKNGAAALLGLHPATLRSRLKVLDIPFGRKN